MSSGEVAGSSLARTTFWTGLSVVSSSLSAFLLIPIITKLMGAEAYGAWASFMAIAILISALSMLGLQEGFVRFVAGLPDLLAVRAQFYAVLVVGGALATIFALLGWGMATRWSREFLEHSAEVEKLAKLGSLFAVVWSLENLTLVYYRTRLRMRRYAVLVILQAALELSVALLVGWANWGVLGLVLGFLFVRLAICMAALLGIVGRLGLGRPSFHCVRPMLVYGFPFLLTGFFTWTVKLSDRVLLVGLLGDLAQVGIYSAAYDIASVIMLFSVPFQQALYPLVVSLWNQKKPAAARRNLDLATRGFLFLAIPSAFGLLVLAESLLLVFAQADFVDAGIWIIPIMAFGLVCYGIYTIAVFVFSLVKKSFLLLMISMVAALLKILLNLLLVPRFGIIGAALATTCTFLVLMVLALWHAFRFIPFELPLGFAGKVILASLGMAWLLTRLDQFSALSRLLLSIPVGIVAYIVLALILKAIAYGDCVILLRGLLPMSCRPGQE